ncbi:MAG: hypothetical protein ACRD3E_11595 [Terriglobales bacterium]
MATGAITPPSGFVLEQPQQTQPTPPAGFVIESQQPQAPAQNANASAAQPQNTISAVHEPTTYWGKLGKWYDDVSNDLKYGTDMTGIGRVLKEMGARGLYAGNDPRVGDFMGSLPLGLLESAKGQAELMQTGKRWQGAKDVVRGAAQAATIPASFVAPEAGDAGAELAANATDKAGAMLDNVAGRGARAMLKDVIESGPTQQEAGAAVQSAAANVKQAAGAAVGAAKQAAVPEDFTLQLDKARNLQSTLSDISDQLGASDRGLQSLHDPATEVVRNTIAELSKPGLTFDAQQLASVKQQLSSQIARGEAAARSGNATGEPARYLKQIAGALNDDYLSAVSEHSGPAAAGELQNAAKNYADVMGNQQRAAKQLFGAKTPEAVIRKLSYPSTDATTVGKYLNGMDDAAVSKVRQGVFRDILQKSTTNGATDWGDALARLERRGDAAKALFGDDFEQYHNALQTAVTWAKRGQLASKAAKIVAGGALGGAAADLGWRAIRDFMGASE